MRATGLAAVMLAALASPALAASPCVSNDTFLVVEVPHKDDVGNSYIIRDNTLSPKPACSTKKAKGDRVIGTNDDPFFLLKLAGPYLLLDEGTGPDRAIEIFDLKSGKKLYGSGYDDESFKADASGASFWAASPAKPTRKNCPNLAKIEKDWLTPVIEVRARFDYATGTVTKSTDQRCRATQ